MGKKRLLIISAILLSTMAQAQTLTPYTSDIISQQPEGTLYNHVARSGTYFRNTTEVGLAFGGYLNYFGDYVLAADSTIYVKNPFPERRKNTWLRIDHVAGSSYVAHTPQAVEDVGDGLLLYATRLEISDPNLVTYQANTTNLDIPFTFKDGVLTMADDNGTTGYYNAPKVILGITDIYGTWYGFADAASVFSPLTDEAAVKPDNVQASEYVLTHNVRNERTGESSTTRELVNVAIDGQDVYINNPVTHDPKYWVKGTIDGSSAKFLTQYAGPDSSTYTHRWFIPATYTPSTYNDDYGTVYTRSYTKTDELDLTYDAASGSFSAPDNTSMVFSVSGQTAYQEVGFDNVTLQPFNEVEATPATPTGLKLTPWSSTTGYGLFTFDIQSTDTEGNFINPEKLYYNIYIDDTKTPFTLRNDEYFALTQPEMTDIPYDFNTGWIINADGDERSLYLYTADIDYIGVQSIYRGAGAEHRSPIAWYGNVPDGINGISANGQTTATTTTFYDLSGRRISKPQQGSLYIKQETFADGSKKAVKVLGR